MRSDGLPHVLGARYPPRGALEPPQLGSVSEPNTPVPNIVGSLPGVDHVAMSMMERRFEDNDTATIEELSEASLDTGIEFRACQILLRIRS